MNNHSHTVTTELSLRIIWTYEFKGRELSWGGAGRVWEGGSKCTNEKSRFLKVVLIQVSLEYDAILPQWTGRAPFCLCNKKLLRLFFPISSVSSSVYNLHLQECLAHFEKAEFWLNSLPITSIFIFLCSGHWHCKMGSLYYGDHHPSFCSLFPCNRATALWKCVCSLRSNSIIKFLLVCNLLFFSVAS